FAELERHGADFTGFFRALSRLLRGDRAALDALLPGEGAMGSWIAAWRARIEGEGGDFAERAEAMDALNPLYIPRNHLVEAALAAAEAGDMTPWLRLLEAVQHPFAARADRAEFAGPASEDFGPYTTFCGT